MSTDTSWNRTSDLPIYSTAPQPLCYRGPLINMLFTVFLTKQVRLLCVWFQLLHSPLTLSRCHSSYSESDMQTGRRSSWPFTCSHTVVGVLTPPFHVPFWAPARSLLSRSPNTQLNGYIDRIIGTVGLHSETVSWYCMTHGTIIQTVDVEGRAFVNHHYSIICII